MGLITTWGNEIFNIFVSQQAMTSEFGKCAVVCGIQDDVLKRTIKTIKTKVWSNFTSLYLLYYIYFTTILKMSKYQEQNVFKMSIACNNC